MTVESPSTDPAALYETYLSFAELLSEVESALDAVPPLPPTSFNAALQQETSSRSRGHDGKDDASGTSASLVQQWDDVLTYSTQLHKDYTLLLQQFQQLRLAYKHWWIQQKLQESDNSPSSSRRPSNRASHRHIDTLYDPNLPARPTLRVYRQRLIAIKQGIDTYDISIPADERASILQWREREQQWKQSESQLDFVDDMFSKVAAATATTSAATNGDSELTNGKPVYDDVPDIGADDADDDIDDHAQPTELRQRHTASAPQQSQQVNDQYKNDILTDEVVDLAVALKQNVKRINEALKADSAVLDKVDSAIDSAAPALQRQTQRLKDMSSRACAKICGLYFLFGVLIATFFFTYLLIKFTPSARR